MSFTLHLASSAIQGANPANFKVDYAAGVPVVGDYEVALVQGNVWFSWYNVAAPFNNNTLKYSPDAGATWKTVTFPDGNYQLDELNDEMHRQMHANNDFDNTDPVNPRYYVSFVPNLATIKTRVELKNNYQMDFSTGTFYQLIGVNQAVMTATTEGPGIVDITRGVDSINVNCDVAGGSWNNSVSGNVIYNFNPRSAPGSLISLTPFFPIYYPIRTVERIYNISVQITDQLGRQMDLNGEDVTFALHFRPVVKA